MVFRYKNFRYFIVPKELSDSTTVFQGAKTRQPYYVANSQLLMEVFKTDITTEKNYVNY